MGDFLAEASYLFDMMNAQESVDDSVSIILNNQHPETQEEALDNQ